MPILPAPLTKSNSPASKKYPRLNRIAGILEARGGIEPPDKGFAGLCLTTWLPRLICLFEGELFLEARDGVEPTMGVLQTPALPLGYRA